MQLTPYQTIIAIKYGVHLYFMRLCSKFRFPFGETELDTNHNTQKKSGGNIFDFAVDRNNGPCNELRFESCS
jgi:hypothetical protein